MLRPFARNIISIPTFSGETTSEKLAIEMKLVYPFISVQSIFSTLKYRRSCSEIPKRLQIFLSKILKLMLHETTRNDDF